jgi:hypothetical protein
MLDILFVLRLGEAEFQVVHSYALLYDYETWSLAVTEQQRLTVFGGRVLKSETGPNKE